MKNQDIVKFNKAVLMRYEPSIQEGIFFLYNVDSESFWSGNKDSYNLLKLIDGKTSFYEICKNLTSLYNSNENEIIDSSSLIIEELVEKNFLRIL